MFDLPSVVVISVARKEKNAKYKIEVIAFETKNKQFLIKWTSNISSVVVISDAGNKKKITFKKVTFERQ